MLNLHTDINCEKDSSEKPNEYQAENVTPEDLHTSMEIFEFKPTIQPEQIEETIECNDDVLQMKSECSEKIDKSTEQTTSNCLNPFVEENDFFLDKNVNGNVLISRNLELSDSIRTIYDEDLEEPEEIVIGDDDDKEYELMEDDAESYEGEEIVIDDTSDDEIYQAEDTEEQSKTRDIGINSDVDCTDDDKIPNTEENDPSYDPSEEYESDDFAITDIDYNERVNPTSTSDGEIPCDLCDKVFHKVEYYRRHKIEICPTEKTVCPFKGCTYVVLNPDNGFGYTRTIEIMCDHIRAKHSREAIYLCSKCPKKCFSKMSLKYHYENHLDPAKYYCLKCQHFILKSSSEKHEAMHAENNFQCELCNKTLATYHGLYVHKLTHEEPKFPCGKCDKKFHQKSNLITHMEKKHGTKFKKDYSCDICNKSFHKAIGLKTHTDLKHGINQKTKYSLEKINKAVCVYTCDACSHSFQKMFELKAHRKVEHGIEKDLNIPKNKPTLGGRTKSKQFQCNVCLVRFLRIANLEKHMLMHSGKPTVKCDFCEKLFFHPTFQRRHMKKCKKRKRTLKIKEKWTTKSTNE